MKLGWSSHFSIPAQDGAYWLYDVEAEDFNMCEVKTANGKRVIYIDSSIQVRLFENEYLVGPIGKPCVMPDGKITSLTSETTKVRVDVESVRWHKEQLNKVNRVELSNIQFYESDQEILVSDERANDWDFTGLHNVDFVLMEAYKVSPETLCKCYACTSLRGENLMCMFVCVKCGNKRCPHAADHSNGCTNSNDVGQKGSNYP